jgi:lysine 6-dehydrogenase
LRVAVLGAGGTIAPALVRDLAESAEVDGLTLLDLDGARVRAVAEAHGGANATAAAVDASDPQALTLALEGCGLLVNAASYRVNLLAMDACIVAGCGYIDLGGLYHVTARQLERSDELSVRGRARPTSWRRAPPASWIGSPACAALRRASTPIRRPGWPLRTRSEPCSTS